MTHHNWFLLAKIRIGVRVTFSHCTNHLQKLWKRPNCQLLMWSYKMHRQQHLLPCSLDFQSVMQILKDCMLKWEIKSKSSTGKGYWQIACRNEISNLNLQQEREYLEQCGVRAFADTDKEQGRKTLHQHWQIWVEDINHSLQSAFFYKDNNTRNKTRQTLKKHIDNFISTSYGSQFCVTHKCISKNDQEISKTDSPENIFKEKDPECFRKARHK